MLLLCDYYVFIKFLYRLYTDFIMSVSKPHRTHTIPSLYPHNTHTVTTQYPHCPHTIPSLYYTCSECDRFSDNTYTEEQWQKMEDTGAVFLPAAGYRTGDDGSYGTYWSSTQDGSDRTYKLYFHTSRLGPQYGSYRYLGRSVRLVHVLQN